MRQAFRAAQETEKTDMVPDRGVGLRQTVSFLELVGDAGGLSAAVRRKNGSLYASEGSAESASVTKFDLNRQSDLQRALNAVKTGKIRWLHVAPRSRPFRERVGSSI